MKRFLLNHRVPLLITLFLNYSGALFSTTIWEMRGPWVTTWFLLATVVLVAYAIYCYLVDQRAAEETMRRYLLLSLLALLGPVCYGQYKPICGQNQEAVCICSGDIGQNCSYVCLPRK